MKSSLSPIILCGLLCLFTFSCQKESTLPPKATGKGGDSSNIEILNDVDKQVISPYKNWEFGSNAYLHTKNILDFGPRPI